jgi:hypothetical protein
MVNICRRLWYGNIFKKSWQFGNNIADRGNTFLMGAFVWIFLFFMSVFQHCYICRPLDSTVSEDAGIEPSRTVATLA